MNNEFNYDRSSASSTQGLGFWWKVLSAWFVDRMRSPVFATIALFIAGTIFAIIVITTYPDAGSNPDDLPVLQADKTPYKTTPKDDPGIDIPYRDSTVFQAMRGEGGTPPVVENLLAPSTNSPDIVQNEPALPTETDTTEIIIDRESTRPPPEQVAPQTMPENALVALGQKPTPKPQTQKSTQKPKAIHTPGSSPETLDFVRSVLDKKAKKSATVTATKNAQTGPKNTYVQLGSVKSEAGAKAEWSNLQKSFSALKGMQYRVRRADLGPKGVYYRIQAGPLSTAKATSLCNIIKAKRPGGCLIVR